jgi:hypothetical protein
MWEETSILLMLIETQIEHMSEFKLRTSSLRGQNIRRNLLHDRHSFKVLPLINFYILMVTIPTDCFNTKTSTFSARSWVSYYSQKNSDFIL